MLNIAGNSDIVAELNLPNGMVNVDWLGFIPVSDDLALESVDTENFTAWFNTFRFDYTYCNPDGADILSEALANSDVREIRFSTGKCYPLSSPIYMNVSDKVINGNGALLITDHHYDDPIFTFEKDDPEDTAVPTNITFRNIRLSHIKGINDVPCIALNDAVNVRLENVTFLMSYYGLDVNNCNGVTLRNVRASNCVKLLSAISTENVTAENISFSNPFRGMTGPLSSLTDSVLSFGAGCEHVALRDIRIVDALCRTAVSVVGTQASPVEYCTISGMLAESVSNVFYWNHARTLSAWQIHAAEIDCAVTMENVSNCLVEESSFRRRAASTDAIVALAAGTCRNAFFNNCMFDSDVWFNVQNRLIDNEPVLGDKIKFENCMFRAGDLSESLAPARFSNSVSAMGFAHCHFYAQALADDGCFFSFSSDANSNSHFKFTGCMLTSAAGIVNAPFRVSLDNGENVYLLVAGCSLCGFRWTTRVTMDSGTVSAYTIDPAASGFPLADDVQSAVQKLTALTRFLALHNTYLYHTLPTGQTEHCRRAETYGVTE